MKKQTTKKVSSSENKITLRLNPEIKAQLKTLWKKGRNVKTNEKGEEDKGDRKFTYEQLIEYLLIKASPSTYKTSKVKKSAGLRGALKVEDKLLDLLHLGHDFVITNSELQSLTGSNYKVIQGVTELYKEEIDKFNLQFNL